MVKLRLWTYDATGKGMSTLFSFSPLNDRDSYDYDRESTRSVGRQLNRRPFARQEVRALTLPAGFLLDIGNLRNVLRLFDAHKIEWERTVGGKPQWVEYALDAGDTLTFERVDEIDPLRRITITLVQQQATWYTDFENKAVAIA